MVAWLMNLRAHNDKNLDFESKFLKTIHLYINVNVCDSIRMTDN